MVMHRSEGSGSPRRINQLRAHLRIPILAPMASVRRYRILLGSLIVFCLTVLLPTSLQNGIVGSGTDEAAATPWVSFPGSNVHVERGGNHTTTSQLESSPQYPPSVLVDKTPPHYRALMNRYLIGPYLQSRVPVHSIDAVIMAAGPDATLAASIHNLFHLCGFRRFIFVVNHLSDCEAILDLVPQHNPQKPHVCLDHQAFYSQAEKQRIASNYPALHQGAPGKLRRGDKKVQVPRMGWYLQQFSKFLIPQLIPDISPQYLAIDGDLVFTRPFAFANNNGTFVMPTTSKSPVHWRYFVDWILAMEEWFLNDTNTNMNFVVGWMVLDRTILKDLIADMNRLIDDNDVFPFNILNQGERIINETFYSEFYVYARYAHYHSPTLYQYQRMAEPARNPGGFKYTCVLTKSTYGQAQSNPKLAPFLIWEEHKQHAFHSCPDEQTTEQMTQLSTIGIWHDFHPPPWGGGNQFLLALKEGLQIWHNMTVLVKSNAGTSVESQRKQGDHTAFSSQVLLANSVTFKGNLDRLEALKAKNNLALVHRVDGPYYSTRYGRPLQNLTIPPTTEIEIPQEDKKTKKVNRELACATIFQSQWSLEANLKIGLNLRNPVLIPNTVDPVIFYPRVGSLPAHGKKIRIVATSHSDNARKGFDTLLWVDQHLDFAKFEVVYMGGTPKEGFAPKQVSVLSQVDSKGVGDFLRSGHIYLAPSRDEPASNAVLEALACGLPVVYQEGSSHAELVGAGGLGFSHSGPELLEALDEIVQHYNQYVKAIHVPTMEEVSRQYLAIMRWCFYMKHLYFSK